MCQIIHKPAGYTLRDDLLQSTCTVNGDGFGFMLYANDTLHSGKVYDGKNSAEAIGEFLKELHDKEVFLHFRFRTRGEVDTDSCHPFKIFDEFERELFFMHNGTIHGFGNDKVVDSLDFGLKIAGPLYGTFLKSGVRNPLKDELYLTIIEEYARSSSKFVLMDNTGDHAIINMKSGTMYNDEDSDQKFWVSNTYSFDDTHRKPKATTYSPSQAWPYKAHTPQTATEPWYPDAHTYRKGADGVYRKIKLDDTTDEVDKSATPFLDESGKDAQIQAIITANTTANTPDTAKDSTQNKSSTALTVISATTTEIGNPQNSGDSNFPERVARLSYIYDILKLPDVEGLFDLEYADIEALCDGEPTNAALLINDLLKILYDELYEDGVDW